MSQSSPSVFAKPSLVTRIAVGKGIGLLFGLIGFIALPLIAPEVSRMFQWAILLWYTTVGAIIGVFGVFTWHPVLSLPMPWWFRAPMIGAWMNFVLVLFIYDDLQAMVAQWALGETFSSPFWLVAEGAIIGMIIGYLATRLGGEGPRTLGGAPE
ncbi:MAG TPA: hypothetical protein DG761_04430 [Gammaproteobacteria bacterium]|jgi:hypothetical protein|nr:hypothetical protein [Arenicellales bacterium]MDP6551536.1 hypothetical protein [Arenicellales bacterium]MDP6790950.1 hypothetical protein [Arenicellales bacterium]MDP6918496.1 hypothetical protein [Arenicellales bacterium]HCX87248.1 hypothetical protein [Gammaproteobacteria bacterium]|tara:strand:- start:14676 stop:15137 length:462 start_codon:yes stop_codon:yes gene_type:complete